MIREIYIPLLNEEIDVWRPVNAEQIDDMSYKILNASSENSKTERLKFSPGTIVHCEYIVTNGGERIFAAISEEKE